jgi:phenylalanyl-tRNA synthetase alpha chain
MNELDSLVAQAKHLFSACSSPTELENAKAQFFGKAGHLTMLMKTQNKYLKESIQLFMMK